MSNTAASSGGIGFGGILFIVFLVLKLVGVIAWPWLWVAAPLWVPVVVVVTVLVLILLIAVVTK